MESQTNRKNSEVYYVFANGDIYKTSNCIHFVKVKANSYDYFPGAINTGFQSFESYREWKSADRKIYEITDYMEE